MPTARIVVSPGRQHVDGRVTMMTKPAYPIVIQGAAVIVKQSAR